MSLTTNKTKIQQLLDGINALPSQSTPSYQEKTVTPTTSSQTVTPDSNYDALSKVIVNAMPTATQATPSITVSSAGLITASSTQSAGYVASGTKSATKQLTVQAAKTVTPTTSNQTAVASGRYTTGAITVKGDANLKADNITEGVSIFGVAGANPYEKTATTTEVNSQATKLTELKTILQGKAAGGGSSGGVETCTVILTYRDTPLQVNGIMATTFVDGVMGVTCVGQSEIALGSYGIENVVCGSGIALHLDVNILSLEIMGDGNTERVGNGNSSEVYLRASTIPNSTNVILTYNAS